MTTPSSTRPPLPPQRWGRRQSDDEDRGYDDDDDDDDDNIGAGATAHLEANWGNFPTRLGGADKRPRNEAEEEEEEEEEEEKKKAFSQQEQQQREGRARSLIVVAGRFRIGRFACRPGWWPSPLRPRRAVSAAAARG